MNETLSERLALVATIDPQLVDNTSVNSDWASMQHLRRILFTLLLGATDTTVNAKLQWATDASGSDAEDIPGKAITQMGATQDNKQAQLEIGAAEMGAFRFVRLVVTVGDGTSGAYVAATGVGTDGRFGPARAERLVSVAQG
jgi:hypothetical protein